MFGKVKLLNSIRCKKKLHNKLPVKTKASNNVVKSPTRQDKNCVKNTNNSPLKQCTT